MFDENDPKERLSQLLVVVEYTNTNDWIHSVQIYPSVDSLNYEIQNLNDQLPLGLNGGLCGLTNKAKFKNDAWMIDTSEGQDKFVEVDLKAACLTTQDDSNCINYTNFWR